MSSAVSIPSIAPTVVYESDESRVSLMYRLRSAGRSPRTLFLTVPGKEILRLVDWDGEVDRGYVGSDVKQLREYRDASFERVVLHWVLDEFVGEPGRRRRVRNQKNLLREVMRILTPGGLIVGCVANLLSAAAGSHGSRLGRTSAKCVRLLESAGFGDTNVSIALPSAGSPSILISTAPVAARHYFRLQLARNAEDLGFLSRLSRRLLIETGLNLHMQGSLIFSARTLCSTRY